MLTSVDTTAITNNKVTELLAEPPERSWAACAAIWSRTFVLSGPGWEKAPETAGAMREAFALAMRRAAGMGDFSPDERLAAALEAFDVDDDGSDQWQSMVDLITMIVPPVRGEDLSDCLHRSLQTYLVMWFHAICGKYGAQAGRPLRLTEAEELVAADGDWAQTVAFGRSL